MTLPLYFQVYSSLIGFCWRRQNKKPLKRQQCLDSNFENINYKFKLILLLLDSDSDAIKFFLTESKNNNIIEYSGTFDLSVCIFESISMISSVNTMLCAYE